MNTQVLKIEIQSDPDTRGYSGMTDAEVADDLNLVRKDRNLTSMTASEVANSIDNTEWTALTADEQRKIWDVLHMGSALNPFGIEATIFNNVFGAGATITALQAARIEQISRATELSLGHVKVGHVEMALAA
jgi:hypothetical protein